MGEGRIYYAENKGSYLLKFVGDVRVTLCTTLSNYINRIFAKPGLQSVILDLTEAKAVDSTTLGFMAKVAIYANSKGVTPVMITDDPSMIRLVESMGFDEIFKIHGQLPDNLETLKELSCVSSSTDETRQQVIESHKILMSMNNKNMHAFSELVKALERESESE